MKINVSIEGKDGKTIDILTAIKELHGTIGAETIKRKGKLDAAYKLVEAAREEMNEIRPQVKELQSLIDWAKNLGMGDKVEAMGIERPRLRGGRKAKSETTSVTV